MFGWLIELVKGQTPMSELTRGGRRIDHLNISEKGEVDIDKKAFLESKKAQNQISALQDAVRDGKLAGLGKQNKK